MKNNGSSRTVNGRQLAVLLIIAIISTKLILMPGLISSISGHDAYLSYTITALVTFASILLCLYICKNSTHKGFYELLKQVFSSAGAKIICLLFFVFFMSKITLIDYQIESFLNEVLYDNLNWVIFVIPFYLVFAFIAFKGPRVLARTAEIIFPIAIGVLLLAVFSAISNVDFLNILPFGANGATNIIKGAITGFGMGGEYLFMFVFIENLSEKSKITPRCIIYGALGFIIVILFLILFASIFGPIGRFIQDALTRLTQFSPIIRQNTQVNGIIVIGWIPIVVLESALNLYCASWCLKKIFGIKQFGYCVIACVVITFGIKLIPSLSVFEMLKIIPNAYAILNLVLQFVIPAVLAIYIAIKKHGERRQNSGKQAKAKQC